jgi:hypothetical protein
MLLSGIEKSIESGNIHGTDIGCTEALVNLS